MDAQFGKRIKGYGAILSSDPVICNEDPDADAQNACIELGKTLYKILYKKFFI